MMRGRLLLALGAAFVFAGCSEDAVGPDPAPQPIRLRTVTPPNAAVDVYDAAGVTLTAVFTRDVDPRELRQNWILPKPVSQGELVANGRRTVEWRGVVFDPDVAVYTWFLDGASFRTPIVLEYHPGPMIARDGVVRGSIAFRDGERNAEDVILYVMPWDARGTEITEGTLTILGLPVERVIRLEAGLEVFGEIGPSSYRLENLEPDTRYVLVALEDTDQDGYYVPGVDWWGYPRDPAHPDVVIPVTARSASGPHDFDANATFTIVRPGALQPEDF